MNPARGRKPAESAVWCQGGGDLADCAHARNREHLWRLDVYSGEEWRRWRERRRHRTESTERMGAESSFGVLPFRGLRSAQVPCYYVCTYICAGRRLVAVHECAIHRERRGSPHRRSIVLASIPPLVPPQLPDRRRWCHRLFSIVRRPLYPPRVIVMDTPPY
jgi:hypothetical protein